MGETQKSIDGIIEKFAMITDAIDTIFPEGKMSIIFELKENDFKRVQNNFKDVDKRHSQFKIDISDILLQIKIILQILILDLRM